MSLWTSRPLQCSTMTSITSSSPQSMEGRLEGPHRKESEVRARSNTVWCPRSPRLLAGLALLAHRFFRPAGDSRIARFLRVGGYVAILALIPAKAIVEQFAFQPPRGGIDLRLYRLISGPDSWLGEILFLVFMALYGAAILWMTSQRSRVAPATLAIGTGAGIVLGVMYAVAPLDSNGPPTNPWLPGADIDPPVVLAWILLFCAPAVAMVAAERRYSGSGSSPPLAGAKSRQVVTAGLLTNLVGALFVTVLGTGTPSTAAQSNLRCFTRRQSPLDHTRPELEADSSAVPFESRSSPVSDAGGTWNG